MNVPIPEAKGRLSELVRRAKAGEQIALTRHGRVEARIVADRPCPSAADVRALLAAVRSAADRRGLDGGRSVRDIQDQLHADLNLP